MRVAYTEDELEEYLKLATKVSKEHPVVISKFVEKAKEVEVDGVSDGDEVLIGAVIEHVEKAGVHSGDATMRIPPATLSEQALETIKNYACRIAKALKIKGPFNIQYLVKNGYIYIIECNLRASRSLPYVSKTCGVNLIELSTMVMLGKKLKDIGITKLPPISHVGVKVPQFSFIRLSGADPVLGVEMLSTGEVACLGQSFADAFPIALEATGFEIPSVGSSVLMTVGGEELKKKLIPLGKILRRKGFRIYATEHTAEALRKAGISEVAVLHKVREPQKEPNIVDYLQHSKIDLVVNIPTPNNGTQYSDVLKDEYVIRRLAIEFNIPVVTNLELASALINLLAINNGGNSSIRSLNEYMESLEWTFW